jgi:hypothetical protein
MASCPCCACGHIRSRFAKDRVMFCPNNENRFDHLERQLQSADALTPELMSDVMTEACVRLAALGHTNQPARLNQLVKSGAWTDAALALIELELPAWSLRRLAYEDGEWLCSLSSQVNLPTCLDDTIDASHEHLPLAILIAFLEARRRSNTVRKVNLRSVPQVRSEQSNPICCDNFA